MYLKPNIVNKPCKNLLKEMGQSNLNIVHSHNTGNRSNNTKLGVIHSKIKCN